MNTKFSTYRIWPDGAHELDGILVKGRTASEAAEEGFLDFVALDDPPTEIALNCRRDRGAPVERVIVELALQRPFRPHYAQPEFAFA